MGSLWEVGRRRVGGGENKGDVRRGEGDVHERKRRGIGGRGRLKRYGREGVK
jgi:hypothetical protein